MRWQWKKHKKSDNRGATIVIVIVALAFIGLLASMILYLSFMNFQMKYADLKNKDNFYTAETVLDEIKVGLQGDVSTAFANAYQSVLQNYNLVTDQQQREENFRTDYLTELSRALSEDGSNGSIYKMSKLEDYVDANLMANTTLEGNGCVLNSFNQALVLKDLTVTYQNGSEVSIITTDIRLSVPEISYTESTVMPPLFSYSLVADTSLVAAQGSKATVTGSVYGGREGIQLEGANTVLSIDRAERVITNSQVTANNGAQFVIGANATLWANGIDLTGGGSEIDLNGKSYIKDDLTLAGADSTAVIKSEYYGYGFVKDTSTATGESGSSAIILNGRNSTLDMSEIDKLLLAGMAYIKSGNTDDNENNRNIRMGQSVALKSDQLAYLVPAECIGVNKTTKETIYGKNPLSGEEYTALIANNNLNEWDLSKYTGTSSLEEITKSGGSVQRIFRQETGGVRVYYYLVLSSDDSANVWLREYYEAHPDKMNQYAQIYSDGIDLNDSTSRLNLAGNMVLFTGGVGGMASVRKDTAAADSSDQEDMLTEQETYANIFAGLCKKLISSEDNLTETEKRNTVFTNLIDKDAVKSYVNGQSTPYATGGSAVLSTEDNSYQALLVDNENGTALTVDSAKFSGTKIGLIIATGDVTVSTDFSGLIIAEGTITTGAASNMEISSNEDKLIRILQIKRSDDETKTVLDFFKDGSKYILNGTAMSGSDSEENIFDLSDLVTYENWTKK